jgi:23S rRNA (pseudouridine1915-N3)-methyltransferase
MQILAVGRLRDSPEAVLVSRYATRIRPKLLITEIADALGGSPAEIKRRESTALLAALPPKAFAVTLDMAGDMPDSPAFAALLDRWLGLGRPVCFLIGGAEGLDRNILDRADFVLSLGRLTWPHALARAMLAEQLYRARAIATGHPYHRARVPPQ